MDFAGKVLSSFRLTEKLGQGAMGVVYKAIHEKTSLPGAVKFIVMDSNHCDDDGSQTLLKRFMDEAKAMSRTKSPYIVRVLAVGDNKDTGPYIVLEFLPGLTLEETLNNETLSLADFMEKLAIPLLTGLSTMHKSGVVHRDIKPGNLIADEKGIFKISDFGLALFKDRAAKTKTGVVIGSPGYMSPENFISTGNTIDGGRDSTISLRSDIYSAGVVLIEALTGVHPFRTPNLGETIKKQVEYRPTSESICSLGSKAGIRISSHLGAVLARALAPRPGDRYTNCADFLREIKAAIDKASSEVDYSESQTLSLDSSELKLPEGAVRRGGRSLKKSSSLQKSQVDKASNSGMRRKLIPVILTVLLLFPVLWLRFFSGSKPTALVQDSVLAEDLTLKKLRDDFETASMRLTKQGSVPSRDCIEEFFDSGLEFYSSLNEHERLSPVQKGNLWKVSASKLKGPVKLLGKYVSSYEKGGENSCNAGMEALEYYRQAFSIWFSATLDKASANSSVDDSQLPLSSLEGVLSGYLEVDSWFVEKLLLSQSTASSDMDYYHKALNLIGSSTKFVSHLLPAVPRLRANQRRRFAYEPPPLWNEAVTYQIKLFLWRAFIFSFRMPVKPYSSFLAEDFKGISEEEYVASVDSGHSIGRAVSYLLDKGTLEESVRTPLKKVCSELFLILKKNERSRNAISSVDSLIASVKDAPPCDFKVVPKNEWFDFIEKTRSLLSDTEEACCGFWENAVVISGSSKFDKSNSVKLVKCATVLARRGIWTIYPLLLLENTILNPGTINRFMAIRLILFFSDFIPYFVARVPMDTIIDRDWFGPGLNISSFYEMFEVVAALPLKGCSPELIWPLDGEEYTAEMLSHHCEYSMAILKNFAACKAFRTSKKFDSKSLFKGLLTSWDEVLSPLAPSGALLSLLVTSERLSLSPDGLVTKEDLAESLAMSRQVLELVKAQINLDELNSTPEPHLRLLLEVSEKRWMHLRQSGDLDTLLSEALWAQKNFGHTLEIQPGKYNSHTSEICIYSLGAAHVGHVYLMRKQTKLFEEQLPFIKKAKDLVGNVSSVRYELVQCVVEGRPLY